MVVFVVVILLLPLTSFAELPPSRMRLTFVELLISVFFPVTGSTEYMVEVYDMTNLGNVRYSSGAKNNICARSDVFALAKARTEGLNLP